MGTHVIPSESMVDFPNDDDFDILGGGVSLYPISVRNGSYSRKLASSLLAIFALAICGLYRVRQFNRLTRASRERMNDPLYREKLRKLGFLPT